VVITDLSPLIWELGDAVQFERIGLVERRQAFSFGGRIVELAVDFERPLSDLCPLFCREFGLEGPISLTLISGAGGPNPELDAEYSLADLEVKPGEVLNIDIPAPLPTAPQATAVKPAAGVYSITLRLGAVPCVGVFALQPTATLAEAEIALKERWKLADLELEFALFDPDTDEMSFLPKDTTIGSIDHGVYSLAVRPAQICSVCPSVGLLGVDSAVGGDSEVSAETRLVQSMKMTVGTVHGDLPVYRFVYDSDKTEFELQFPLGATGADVRSEIGRRFGLASKDVSLFFKGKTLKDVSVMDRLCLGGPMIAVYLEDPSRCGTAAVSSPS
jgi:hypothetical protein